MEAQNTGLRRVRGAEAVKGRVVPERGPRGGGRRQRAMHGVHLKIDQIQTRDGQTTRAITSFVVRHR